MYLLVHSDYNIVISDINVLNVNRSMSAEWNKNDN